MDIDKIRELDDKFASYFKIYNRWHKLVFSNDLMRNIIKEIDYISEDIKQSHPFISKTLSKLKYSIFTKNHTLEVISTCRLNDILNILINEYNNINIWRFIHPRIISVSRKLYYDGHYSNSVLNAFIEINDIVKKIYKKTNKDNKNIPDGQELMNKVFSEKDPLLDISKINIQSGKNIHNGTRSMLVGAMSALRNPKAHANISISAEDAMRQLMFASMLMYLIDDAINNENIDINN